VCGPEPEMAQDVFKDLWLLDERWLEFLFGDVQINNLDEAWPTHSPLLRRALFDAESLLDLVKGFSFLNHRLDLCLLVLDRLHQRFDVFFAEDVAVSGDECIGVEL